MGRGKESEGGGVKRVKGRVSVKSVESLAYLGEEFQDLLPFQESFQYSLQLCSALRIQGLSSQQINRIFLS